MFYDAHNHLQDERLDPWRESILTESKERGVRMVVNGTSERDWQRVINGASHEIIPSIGLHPWFVKDRSPDWHKKLESHLDTRPCGVGEIGLDRWMKDPDIPAQVEVFVTQLETAARRNLPASIHCLKDWGRLHDLLGREKRPACGFLLHSYSGPREMVKGFLDLGAYFSISGYFAHERKAQQREVFRTVPLDRILIETDAPDMTPPAEFDSFKIGVNHPGNIFGVYRFVAGLLALREEDLATQVERNFQTLFGSVQPKSDR